MQHAKVVETHLDPSLDPCKAKTPYARRPNL